MLLKAKKNKAIATKILPAEPISFVNACCVSCTPLVEPSSGAPLKSIMNAVQVHIINVSVKTPKVCISPCFTGCVTCAVAATLGAEPIPASLLNNPRLMPCINAIPTPPPNTCCQPKAWLTMSLITAGSSVMLIATIISAKAIYPNAIMGTIMLLTLAMRCTPPKIISSVAMVITPPTMAWSKPNACSKAAHSVLLCTELKAKPKVIVMSTANTVPIHGCFNPFRI